MLSHSGEECIKQKGLLLCLVTTRGWRRKDFLCELKHLQTILFKNGMQLFVIKTDTFYTAMLGQYLNQSNAFQPLKYIASKLDCANCDLVCYQLTTIFIATVLVLSREIVYFV